MSQADCIVGLVCKQVNAADADSKIDISLPAELDSEVADVD